MFGINLKHSLAIVAVAVGLLAAAGSASAGTHQFGERAVGPTGFSIDIGTSENIAADGLVAGYILMADAGGQF